MYLASIKGTAVFSIIEGKGYKISIFDGGEVEMVSSKRIYWTWSFLQ